MNEFDQYLAYLTHKGASERYPEYIGNEVWAEVENTIPEDDPSAILRRRIDHELDVIHRSGFPQYFLIVADLMQYCRGAGIPVGPGRGSVCGSVVAYATYITDVEPIQFGIPFERFLHLDRIAMPDIDIDLCKDRRHEAIAYLRHTYGHDSVAQIIAFGTMMAKGAILDVMRILNYDNHAFGTRTNKMAVKLADMIPEGSGSDQISLKDWLETDESADFRSAIEPLTVPFENRDIPVLDTILRLEGLRRHGTIHAAGVVIGSGPLIDLVPLYRKSKDSEVQTQFDYRDCEDIGLLKLDVLGLRTVTVIGEAERLVRERNPGFIAKDVPLDDEETFQLLQAGDTVGVFQLEGQGMTGAVTGVAPDRFDDIIAIIALYRPGPMDQLDSYIARKHGKEEISYAHPDMAAILKRTYGLIVYQEQVMGLARLLAGHTPGEADLFRKAIGKKLPELIREQIELFAERAVARGYDPDLIEGIGHQIAFFGRYGFNLGHATGYAFITYWTAYLKANYPTEFYTACLNSNIGDLDRVSAFIRDAARRGVTVLGPDINRSKRRFINSGPTEIIFGLEGIKGVGASVVEDIVEERDETEKNAYRRVRVTREKPDGKPYQASIRASDRVVNKPRRFKDLHDFCERLTHVPVNVKESLVLSGAFEKDLDKRARLLAATRSVNEAAKKGRRYDPEDYIGPLADEIAMLGMEREAMGFYVTKHPMDVHRAELNRHGAIVDGAYDVKTFPTRSTVAGLVADIRLHNSSRGQMAWIKLETNIRGLPDLTCFNDIWAPCKVKKGDTIIAQLHKKHNKKYGWGLIIQSVMKLNAVRPRVGNILVSMPDTDPIDILQLSRMTATEGAELWVLVMDACRRMALIRTDSYIGVTGKTVKDLEANGWQIRYDYSPGDPAPLGEATCVRSSSNHGGTGTNRSAVWELPVVRHVTSSMGGKAIAEMNYDHTISTHEV